MSSEIVEAYKNYYKHQTSDSFIDLFDKIKSYDFKSYEEDSKRIIRLHSESSCRFGPSTIKSNGSSTGSPREFQLGPNASDCIWNVERHLRMRSNKTIFVYTPGFGNEYVLDFQIDSVKDCPKRDIDILGNFAIESHIVKLLEALESYCAEFGVINIVSHPHIWIFLSTNPSFREWTQNNKSKIGAFVNSDWEPSHKKLDIYFRDQMIDWKSGINFFTCESGSKHFLPIFCVKNGYSCNFLNLKKEHSVCKIDDILSVGKDLKICPCGQPALQFDFLAHIKNKILNKFGEIVNFETFYDLLESNYQNLQIHQSPSGEVTVFYATKSVQITEDLHKIRSFLTKSGLDKIKFAPSKYFQLGRKRYSFWRSESVQTREFFVK